MTATELPLVGREAESAALLAALAAIQDGRPAIAIVRGDLGMGKTRLVTETLRVLQPVVLSGACAPVAGEPLPYAPIVQALRRLEAKPSGRKEIAGFPDLLRLLSGEGAEEVVPGVRMATGPQWRLYEAVHGLLQSLARRRPVVLVVEDLHWADAATVDLLAQLAIAPGDGGVGLVLTHRTDHGRPGDPVQAAVAELGRLRHTTVIGVPPLGEAEALRLARLADPAMDPERAAALVGRAGGNPLLLQHLGERPIGAESLPATVSALFRARLDGLDPGARSLVHGLAVLGGRAELDLLLRVLDLPEDAVERDLIDAVARHVLVIEDRGVAFRHPASAEVAYDDALPTERRRLHRRAADALAQRTDDASVLALAKHWERADAGARSLPVTIAAAEIAGRRWAFAEAARLYRRAEELLAPGGADSGAHRSELLRVRLEGARAAALTGASTDAVAMLRRILHAPLDPEQRADVLWRLGAVHFAASQREAAEAVLTEARDLISDTTGPVAAAVYAWSARVAAAWSQIEDADAFGEQALRLATDAGLERLVGIASNALGVVAAVIGDTDLGTRRLRLALHHATRSGSADDLVAAYVNLGHVLGLAGDPESQLAVCDKGIEHLGRWGVLRHSGSILIANAVEALIELGRLDEALGRARAGVAMAPEGLLAVPVLMRAAQAAALTGAHPQARAWIDEADALAAAPDTPATWRLSAAEAAAEVALWAGEPERAADRCLVGLADAARAGLPRPSALTALAWRAVADLADAGPVSVGGTTTRLGRLLARWPAEADALERAECARAAGVHRADLWQAAHDGVHGAVPRAYARWREADARLRSGVDVDAIAALRSVDAQSRRLGLAPISAEVELAARWYRVALVAELAGESPAAGETAFDAGLTPRELETLAALADGCSNGEVGARLGISVKTASVHVSNILRKLGVASRQDAARVAHRHGIGAR